jgi:hypothetical protein
MNVLNTAARRFREFHENNYARVRDVMGRNNPSSAPSLSEESAPLLSEELVPTPDKTEYKYETTGKVLLDLVDENFDKNTNYVDLSRYSVKYREVDCKFSEFKIKVGNLDSTILHLRMTPASYSEEKGNGINKSDRCCQYLTFFPYIYHDSVVKFEDEEKFEKFTKYVKLIAKCTTINKLISYCKEIGIKSRLNNIDHGISVVSGFFGYTDKGPVEVKSIDFDEKKVKLENVSSENVRNFREDLSDLERVGKYNDRELTKYSLEDDKVPDEPDTYYMRDDSANEVYLIFIYDPAYILKLLEETVSTPPDSIGGKRRRTKRFTMKQRRRKSHKSRRRRSRRY